MLNYYKVRVLLPEGKVSFEFITNDADEAYKMAKANLLTADLVTITYQGRVIYKHAKPYKKPRVVDFEARYG